MKFTAECRDHKQRIPKADTFEKCAAWAQGKGRVSIRPVKKGAE